MIKLKNIIFLLLFIFATNVVNAEKYGLIIAIGDYPENGKWQTISSVNDVEHVKNGMLKLGFDKSRIIHLIDAEATRKGIIQSFQDLIDNSKTGDIIYIHFSGHGQQIMDDNGDELDGLDEAIVPYDSPMLFEKGKYEGEKLIRDDLIGSMITEMRQKCGKTGQVVLVLDSCHSGTGIRGMGKVRGTNRLMAPDDFIVTLKSGEKTYDISKTKTGDMASIASFFGASPRELNYETIDEQSNPVGSLSFALSVVLMEMKEMYSFNELFDHVRLKMKVIAPYQNPQWEGSPNTLILGGEKIDKKLFFDLISWTNKEKIVASFGTVNNVYNGSSVEIYSMKNNVIVARGQVTNSLLTTATIDLEQPFDYNKNELYKIKLLERAFPPLVAFVDTRIEPNSKWNNVIHIISNSPIVKNITSNADIYITECGDDNDLQLASKDGTVLDVISLDETKADIAINRIQNILRSYVQGKFLRSFENPSSNFEFDLKVVTVACENQKLISDNTQQSLFKVGTCVQFEVKNIGVVGAYFSILDIQPDNIINVVCPAVALGYTASEYYLNPNETFITNYPIEIAQPSGEETLKLIASKSPLDLSGIISTQGRSTRGINDMDDFEKVFSSTYNISTRGAVVKRSKKEEVGTKTIYFKIVE